MTARKGEGDKPAAGAQSRLARLAEALRANLGKRKAQVRARRETATTRLDDERNADRDGD
jgi:hypothetical protein